MQTECISAQLRFEDYDMRRPVAGFDGGVVTSDARGLVRRKSDRALRPIERIAVCIRDARAGWDGSLSAHSGGPIVC